MLFKQNTAHPAPLLPSPHPATALYAARVEPGDPRAKAEAEAAAEVLEQAGEGQGGGGV